MPVSPPLHLAVALDGAGWHPAAHAEPGARTDELFTAGYWADLALEAEAGLLDFLTIEDSLGPRPWGGVAPGRNGSRTGDVRGRLDAVLTAARIAPLTSRIGLIPAAVVTHTEPFHVSTAIATLDYASEGRAGVRLRVGRDEASHFGRRPDLERHRPEVTRGTPEADRLTARLFDEAADYAEVLRRLWDSWEDDAVIRDVPTGRFIDRDKLHYIDFEGEWFSVRGPSITPRPPQGQPVIAVLAHNDIPFRLAARSADLAFITPHDRAEASAIIAKIQNSDAERISVPAQVPAQVPVQVPVRVYADLTVFIDAAPGAAAARRARLDEAAGAVYKSDTEIVAGTPAEIADLLLDLRDAGLAGFRLRPAVLPHDLEQITRGLVPELQRRGAFRTAYAESGLRERLGLDPHPANRYASTEAAS